MTAYLVIGRCEIDDVPMLLTDDLGEARLRASLITEADVIRVAADVMELDTSIVVAIGIVSFFDGSPIDLEMVKEFDVAEIVE